MKKAETLIIQPDGKRRIGSGNIVFCTQSELVVNENGEKGVMSNTDWYLEKGTDVEYVVASLSSFLQTIEEVFGEKMVAEMIMHYAVEKNHIIETPQGAAMNIRSKGLKFKTREDAVENED